MIPHIANIGTYNSKGSPVREMSLMVGPASSIFSSLVSVIVGKSNVAHGVVGSATILLSIDRGFGR